MERALRAQSSMRNRNEFIPYLLSAFAACPSLERTKCSLEK